MTRSDTIKHPVDVTFRQSGTGHLVTRRCDKCMQARETRGSKTIRGLWNCGYCVLAREAKVAA